MHKLTVVFGVLLIAIAVGAFYISGRTDPGTLHPAGIGVLLVLFGSLASTEDVKRRALWMHLAVVAGLIGAIFGLKGAYQVMQLSHGAVFPNPIGVEERALICLVCLIFVGFCVRSFIEARRTRISAL